MSIILLKKNDTKENNPEFTKKKKKTEFLQKNSKRTKGNQMNW